MTLLATLPGALLAGQGALLAIYGHQLARLYCRAMSIALLAALGCALGAWTGLPAVALVGAALGAGLGFALGAAALHVYVASLAAGIGLLAGAVAAHATGYSTPHFLWVACAASAAILAVLSVRWTVIVVSSLAGSLMMTVGILMATQGGRGDLAEGRMIPAVILGSLCAAAGIWFQARTTEPAPAPPRPLTPPVVRRPAENLHAARTTA